MTLLMRSQVEFIMKDSINHLLVVQDVTLKIKIILLFKSYLKSIIKDEITYLENFKFLLYCITGNLNTPLKVVPMAVKIINISGD